MTGEETEALKHGIRNPETETESRKQKRNTEYGIRERRFQAIDLQKNIYISNDNKINKQIKKRH